tara:strand:- start:4393 stop:5658 length:1266 start_codon:yes stop_codon:yes gene_type:complete
MYNLILHKKKSFKDLGLSKILNFKEIDGNFCIIKKKDRKFFILRDHLGTKKLFWLIKKGNILLSDNFIKLSKLDKSNKNIRSFRSGFLTIIEKNGKIISLKKLNKPKTKLPKNINDKNLSILIKNKINIFLKALKANYGNEVYVCLSGGLDSTVIAFLASKIFKKVTAISCTLVDSKKYYQNLNPEDEIDRSLFSQDFLTAKKISEILGIEFKPIIFNELDCLKDLKKVMLLSQDWRDFNVHCAILNYQIAKALKKDKKYKSQPLITGDFMNEFVADYKSEKINKKKYYEIPIKDKKRKQQFLINGLKSSDRENGIFNNFHIPSFQPYSSVLDIFENLPQSYLNHENIKYRINGKIIDKKLLNIINRKKIRAQVGGSGGGILGTMIKNKVDQKKLIKIFTQNFKFDEQFLKSFIFLGDYTS